MDAACPPGPRTVLVVEDDDATRAFLLDNLAADGFRVAGASGAGEGLRAIEVRQPALVVLDLLLEDGNGLGLLDRVRAADGLSSRIDPDLPVVVLSGRGGDADRVRSFARGADDHLNKPSCRFPRQVLRTALESRSGSSTKCPMTADVVFGRDTDDLVIGGKAGKGARAVTHAAFTIGLRPGAAKRPPLGGRFVVGAGGPACVSLSPRPRRSETSGP
jgi:CheY-like chemotaxis protein